MKKGLNYILIIVAIFGLFTPTNFAHAWSLWPSGVFPSATNLIGASFGLIFQGLLYLISWITGLSGLLLNYVLKYTIIDMKTNISNLTGINIAWKVIRDVMNIFFIFMLIYEGILLIIGLGNTQRVKKFIIGLVLASILINFSLFFTKVMIDASNVVTLGFYNAMIVPPNGTAPAAVATYGLSNPIFKTLGITNFYGVKADASFGAGKGVGAMFVMFIGTIAVMVVTFFIFFAIAIMFMVRYLVLIFLLMLSPIAYMGMALPFMRTYANQWWDSFRGQLLFGPVYMMLTWVVLKLMSQPGFVTGTNDFTAITNAGTDGPSFTSMGLIVNFALIIGLLIISLVAAKNIAKQGSDLIGKATGMATTFAGGAILGGAAWAGRRTVGAGASRLSESQRFQNWAGRSKVGEIALNRTRGVAESSFDVRASRVGKSTTGALGIDLGKAQQGGYNKTLKEKTEAKEEFGKSLRGDTAKELYASRLANRPFTRGGSNSSARSLFGVLGRDDRVVSSRILNKQLEPLESTLERQQNREVTLTQQETNIMNEIARLQAMNNGAGPNAGSNEANRLNTLTASAYQPAPPGSAPGTRGAANRSSLAYIQDQLNNTRSELANTTVERDRIRTIITNTGLVNQSGVAVPGQATPGQLRRQTQLNNQLAMINRVVATNPGGTPTPTQAARIANINTQLAGLQNAINATIATTTAPANPALGVRNIQTGVVRGRRADEQNF